MCSNLALPPNNPIDITAIASMFVAEPKNSITPGDCTLILLSISFSRFLQSSIITTFFSTVSIQLAVFFYLWQKWLFLPSSILLLQHFQPHRHAYHVSKAVDGSFRVLLQQLIRQEQLHGEGVGLPFYFLYAEKGVGFEEWRRYAFM